MSFKWTPFFLSKDLEENFYILFKPCDLKRHRENSDIIYIYLQFSAKAFLYIKYTGLCKFFIVFHIFTFISLFLERGEGREKERERNIHVWLPLMLPQVGTWPTTQACALTGNRMGDVSFHRPAPNPLSHTSWGVFFIFLDTVGYNPGNCHIMKWAEKGSSLEWMVSVFWGARQLLGRRQSVRACVWWEWET